MLSGIIVSVLAGFTIGFGILWLLDFLGRR